MSDLNENNILIRYDILENERVLGGKGFIKLKDLIQEARKSEREELIKKIDEVFRSSKKEKEQV